MAGPPRGADWRFVGAAGPGSRPPTIDLPEVAFAGKSNVGKSSLINQLTHASHLARTSRTPGRTQQINFFVGRDEIAFADLPGYGFARVPESIRAAWKPLVESYLHGRETLRAIVVIVDVRRGVGPEDARLLELIDTLERPSIVVANKVDKLGAAERRRALAAIEAARPDVLPFSALSGEGERELWSRLADAAALR